MIKLLESEKYLVQQLLSTSSQERIETLKEYGLAVMLIMSAIKSIITQPDQSLSDYDLHQMIDNIEDTLEELKKGIGYTGPIGQA